MTPLGVHPQWFETTWNRYERILLLCFEDVNEILLIKQLNLSNVFFQKKEEIHDAFIEKLKSKIEKALVLGDGMDPAVNQGPLINQPQFTKVND